MIETFVIALVLYTGWRVLRWVARMVREMIRILGLMFSAVADELVRPSQAERDRQAIERLLREVSHVA